MIYTGIILPVIAEQHVYSTEKKGETVLMQLALLFRTFAAP